MSNIHPGSSYAPSINQFVPFPPSTLTWTRKWLHSQQLLPKRPNIKSRSLTALCMEQICNQNVSLPPNLASLPPSIWKQLKTILLELHRIHGINFDKWLFFIPLLKRLDPADIPISVWVLSLHSCSTEGPFPHVINHLSSPGITFISHLVITGNTEFTEHDFIALGGMPNLGVLEIHRPWIDNPDNPFIQITDRLIRAACEQHENPFPLLRVLRLVGDLDITPLSLEYLASLPSLVLIKACLKSKVLLDEDKDGWAGVPSPYWIAPPRADSLVKDLGEFSGHPQKNWAILSNPGHPYGYNSYGPRIVYSRGSKVNLLTGDEEPPKVLPLALADVTNLDHENRHAASRITVDTTCSNTRYAHWGITTFTSTGDGNIFDRDIEKLDPKFRRGKEGAYTMIGSIKVPLPPRPFVTVCVGHMENDTGSDPVFSGRSHLYPTAIFRRSYDDIERQRTELKWKEETRIDRVYRVRKAGSERLTVRKKARVDDVFQDLQGGSTS